jgi:hypothetical protein
MADTQCAAAAERGSMSSESVSVVPVRDFVQTMPILPGVAKASCSLASTDFTTVASDARSKYWVQAPKSRPAASGRNCVKTRFQANSRVKARPVPSDRPIHEEIPR